MNRGRRTLGRTLALLVGLAVLAPVPAGALSHGRLPQQQLAIPEVAAASSSEPVAASVVPSALPEGYDAPTSLEVYVDQLELDPATTVEMSARHLGTLPDALGPPTIAEAGHLVVPLLSQLEVGEYVLTVVAAAGSAAATLLVQPPTVDLDPHWLREGHVAGTQVTASGFGSASTPPPRSRSSTSTAARRFPTPSTTSTWSRRWRCASG